MMSFFKKKEYKPKDWTVIMIGELDIVENSFPVKEFGHPERIFAKAEMTPDTPAGTVNDVYYLQHLNKEKCFAIYFKRKV